MVREVAAEFPDEGDDDDDDDKILREGRLDLSAFTLTLLLSPPFSKLTLDDLEGTPSGGGCID